MAARKGGRSSKTEHVLNLLSHPTPAEPAQQPQEQKPSPAPAVQESPATAAAPATPAATAPVAVAREEPAPQRHLSPPILEVARTNNEALEETIHTALAAALEAEVPQEPTASREMPPFTAPDPEAQPVPEPEPIPEPQPAPEPEPVPQPQPAPEPEPVPQPQPAPEPEPVPQPQPAPKPEPVPEPQPAPKPNVPPISPAPAEDAKQADTLPDGSRFTNVMLLLVEEKLERYVKMFHLCTCPRCLADTKALALSRLPAKYVVLPAPAYSPMLNLYRSKYDSAVTSQIIYACKEVMESPRHQTN